MDIKLNEVLDSCKKKLDLINYQTFIDLKTRFMWVGGSGFERY